MISRSTFLATENLSLQFPRNPNSGTAKTDNGKKLVLDRVTVNLKEGDRLAVMGRNGSGKSTLLRAFAGVLPPTGGRIWSKGTVAAILSASAGFEKTASGMDNIFLRGMLLGMTKRQIEKAIPSILKFADLGEALHEPMHTYSSGMVIRLAFAICTSSRPSILLLDEWIGTGDAVFVERAENRLAGLLDNARIMVLTTHSADLIKRFCNRAVVLEGGRIVFDGQVEHGIGFYKQLVAAAKLVRLQQRLDVSSSISADEPVDALKHAVAPVRELMVKDHRKLSAI